MEQITKIIRQVGQNFVVPLFNGDVDPGIAYKESYDQSLGLSPVGIADVGTQILVARELAKLYPGDTLFGEEFVPAFSKANQNVINAFTLSKTLTDKRKDAREFLDLVQSIIASGKTLPKTSIENYRPLGRQSWLIDPIDGTIPFARKEPKFSILLARINYGCVTSGWMYRPVQDEMFRRQSGDLAQHVLFCGNSEQERIGYFNYVNFSKMPLKEMTVVNPIAHKSVALDAVTTPIYEKKDGERYSFEQLAARFKNKFKAVEPTDGYSYHFGEMFLGKVDAVNCPSAYPWDHFAPAIIADGAGYKVGFMDGQRYLGNSYSVPFVINNAGVAHVRNTGGVLYAKDYAWDEVNLELNVKHHPLRERILDYPAPVLRIA